MRTWCVMDLVLDHKTGKLRETALWSNIGKAVMTWAFVYSVMHEHFNELLWAVYGGVVLGHEAYARFMNQRQQTIDKEHANVSPAGPHP
jgi:hypothetical protein